MLIKSPIILLSVVNTKLRDDYSSLDKLCDDLNQNEDEIKQILASIGFYYDNNLNQFKQK